mgnify:CR=1 FL=1
MRYARGFLKSGVQVFLQPGLLAHFSLQYAGYLKRFLLRCRDQLVKAYAVFGQFTVRARFGPRPVRPKSARS